MQTSIEYKKNTDSSFTKMVDPRREPWRHMSISCDNEKCSICLTRPKRPVHVLDCDDNGCFICSILRSLNHITKCVVEQCSTCEKLCHDNLNPKHDATKCSICQTAFNTVLNAIHSDDKGLYFAGNGVCSFCAFSLLKNIHFVMTCTIKDCPICVELLTVLRLCRVI